MPTATLTPTVWTVHPGAVWSASTAGGHVAAVDYDGSSGVLRATDFTGLPAGAAVSRLTVRVRRRADGVKLVDAVFQAWAAGEGTVGPNAGAAGATIPTTAADLTLVLTDPAVIAAALTPGGGGVAYSVFDGVIEPPWGGESPAGGGVVTVETIAAEAEYA